MLNSRGNKVKNILKTLSVLVIALGTMMMSGCGNDSTVAPGPAPLAAFNLAAFPVSLTGAAGNGYGNIALDRNGDLLVVGGGVNNLWTIARADGALTVVALTGVAGTVVSVADNGTAVYIGDSLGNVYTADTATGACTLLVAAGALDIQGLAVAPASFGAFAGQLIAADRSGNVLAIDAAGTVTTVAAGAAPANTLLNLAFAADGTLYIVDQGGNLSTVTAAGVVAVFATGLGAADGVTVDDTGARVFVFAPGTGINSVDRTTGVVTLVSNAYALDGGYWPSGAYFDAAGGDLFLTTIGAPSAMVETFKP